MMYMRGPLLLQMATFETYALCYQVLNKLTLVNQKVG